MRKSCLWILPCVTLAAFLGCKRDPAPEEKPATAPAVAIQEEPPAPLVEDKKPEKPLVPLAAATGAQGTQEGSVIALAKLGGRTLAYLADEEGSAIVTTDPKDSKVLATTPLPGRPAQMLLGKDGKLFVALRDRKAVLVLASTADADAPLERTEAIPTAVEPIALAAPESGEVFVVASGWGHSLEVFRQDNHERVLSADLAREPRAVTVSRDGARAFVSHAAAGHVSVVDLKLASAEVKKIDVGMAGWTEFHRDPFICRLPPPDLMLQFSIDESLAPHPRGRARPTGGPASTVTFPSRFARQGFALAKVSSKGAEKILVPHVDVATGDATVVTTGYGGGGMEGRDIPSEMFDIDVLDAAKGEKATGPVSGVGIDKRIGEGACRLPRAAVVDTKTQRLFVSCVGNRQVIEYDATTNLPTEGKKRSFAVPAGVMGIALDEERNQILAFSQFDRSLTFLPREEAAKGKPAPRSPSTLTLGGNLDAKAQLAQQGRALFHTAGDPKIAHDGRACASCHPDGRDDGLVWPTPEGPRQTILLAGRIGRGAPFGWRAQHDTLKEHMRQTMKNLRGSGLSDAEYEALEAWLVSMKGPPALGRPLDEVEQRGRVVFEESAGCGGCHLESGGFSDHGVHDVGSATATDREKSFLAPSLRFVAESAPYFHDGRYATLEELLRKSDGKMGSTAQLTPADFKALEAYLRTL